MLPCVRENRQAPTTAACLPGIAAEVSGLGKGHDPWALMNPDEMARLASLWARNPEFAAFHCNQGKFPLDYLKKEMFKALPAADTPEFADLPAPVRDLIDEKRAPRPQWWFMAIHYAKQPAGRSPPRRCPLPTKLRQDNLAAFRKRLDALQPKDKPAVFRRMRSPKRGCERSMKEDIAKAEADLAKLGQLEAPFKRSSRRRATGRRAAIHGA